MPTLLVMKERENAGGSAFGGRSPPLWEEKTVSAEVSGRDDCVSGVDSAHLEAVK